MTHENTTGADDLADSSTAPDIRHLFFTKARSNERIGDNFRREENFGRAMHYYRIAVSSYNAIEHTESAKKCAERIDYCLGCLKQRPRDFL